MSLPGAQVGGDVDPGDRGARPLADASAQMAASCCCRKRSGGLALAERLAAVIPDERDASRVIHRLPDILRARIFAIACGYEDGDDLDRLRSDPTFKLACGERRQGAK
jgi:Transposase DDE domain group 1